MTARVEKGRKRTGTGLTLLLHAAALYLLFVYRPVLPPEEAPDNPLKVLLEPAPPPPPEVQLPVRQPRRPAAAAAPAPAQRRLSPGGGGRPEMLDVTPSPLPTFPVPPSLAPPTGGDGGGEGTGSGAGSGSGAGEGAGSGGGGSVQHADWIVKPEDKMPMFNPPRAILSGTSGDVVLHCQVGADTRARNCRVVQENPGGYGFGAAALRVSRYFRLRPPMVDGSPQYDKWVTVPVSWFNTRPKPKR